MRFFASLSYNGKAYSGWQRQPNAFSVQECIEQVLSKILRTKIEVAGCGRTDTGVHASKYYLHFDFEAELPNGILKRINKMLPPDIAFFHFYKMYESAHTRFDATKRSYEYHFIAHKNPFFKETAYAYPFYHKLDREKLKAAAALLLEYSSFATFCKSKSDAKTMDCQLFRSEWEFDDQKQRMIYHISANRFLRGMVRLIVGMQLNVGLGKVSLETVKEALDKQVILEKSLSAPPHGLFLSEVKYEGLDFGNELL